jgi:3-hydroxyisobutyrate dehydrogenase-like beta-hydroxyacid dehydrogenase
MRLGFIGLGNMGAPIARNLMKAGHQLVVYNRTRERAEALAGEGAKVADSPAAAAQEAEAVFTMLSDDAVVEATVFGEHGVLLALPKGALHVSMSTIGVALSDRLARAHEEQGQHYVAAPVFGRPDAAAAAKLWALCAGPDAAVERCLPLLAAVSQGTHRLGTKASRANLVKLTGNFLIVSMIEALGEAFALVRKAGIAPGDFFAVLAPMFGGAPILSRYAAMIAEGNYEPAGFKLRLGLKDVRLCAQASESVEVPMPLLGILRDSFLAAISHGHGEADWGAVALASAERAGL